MWALLGAEWRKVSKNVWLTLSTVWLPAYGVAIVFMLRIMATLADPNVRESYERTDWLLDALAPWTLLTGEVGAFGRLLPLIFAAMVLANEYQSGMWKNLLPGNQRWQLWVAKYVVLLVYVALSFMAFSLLYVGLSALLAYLNGYTDYLPTLTLEVVQNFGRQYGRELVLGLSVISMLIWVAGLAAIIGRSVLVSLAGALFFSMFENTIPALLGLVSRMYKNPDVMVWAQLTPSLNVVNIRYWMVLDKPYHYFGLASVPEVSLGFSILVLAVWVIGLMAATLLLFQRQDITQ